MFSFCWHCLFVFPRSKFPKTFFCFPPAKSCRSKAVWCLCVCARWKVCVCRTEREKTEQDRKRSTESQDENKIKFGEKCSFPMTSVLFLTNLKPNCTPGLEAGLVHSVEERKGKTEGNGELGRRRRKKRKQHFRFLEGWRLNQPRTWVVWGVLAAVVGWGSQTLQEKDPSATTSVSSTIPAAPINTPHRVSWHAACYLR